MEEVPCSEGGLKHRLALHAELKRAESLLAIHMLTEKLSLAALLHAKGCQA